jgi:SH3-like domain-containing protein
MSEIYKKLLALIIAFSFHQRLEARATSTISSYCPKYWVSTKTNKVNLHVGPGQEYKVLWTYTRFVPFIVLAKFDVWRKVIGPDGIEGWIRQNQLSAKRFLITKSKMCNLYTNPNEKSEIVVKIKKDVIMKLKNIKNCWCKVEIESKTGYYSGWIKKDLVFGV